MKLLALIVLSACVAAQPAIACRVGGTNFYFVDELPATPPEDAVVIEGRLFTNVVQISRFNFPQRLNETEVLVGIIAGDGEEWLPLYAWPTSCTHGLYQPPNPDVVLRVVGEPLPAATGRPAGLRLYGYRTPQREWVPPGGA